MRSVGRALDMIELVASAPPDGLSLSTLNQALGMSKSSALATARTLVAYGLLRSTLPGPRYKLGISLIRLGDLTARQQPLSEVCRPILRELADRTGATARVALVDEGYPLFVDRIDGPGTVRFYTPLGRRESPHSTAAGKAILATLTEAEVRSIARDAGLPAKGPHTITRIDRLLTDLETVRSLGYSCDDEEDAEGVFCVGAPFFDHNGECVGALSITNIKTELAAGRIDELGALVRHHADRVSEILNGRQGTGALDLGALVRSRSDSASLDTGARQP